MNIHKRCFRILFPTILCFIFNMTPIQAEVKSVNLESDTENVSQSNQNRVVKGIVSDENKEPIPGATIIVKGTTRGVITDNNGTFSIEVKDSDILVVQFIGMETVESTVKGKENLNFILLPKADELDEVTIVAFAKQKKESVVSSISTINPSELKIPSSNLTNSLGGRIAGIISRQTSGEPGADNSEFFIRGVTTFGYTASPLILIDNVELSANDLARLQVDDIASFSIMKDAAATALYGARGANGVIMVTTKEGREGKPRFNFRFENSFSMPTRDVETVDPVTYMKLHNEAVLTRSPLDPRPYSDHKIESTVRARGDNSYMYPSVDWRDELFKDFTSNQRINMNLGGGGKVARYYIAGTLNSDNGILKVDQRNNFNNNIKFKRMQLRSNINLTVTPTTKVNVRFSGSFDDYNGPMTSGNDLYKMVMQTNSVLFPKYYLPNDELVHTKHTLFGNAEGTYLNPYAEMVKGYKESSTTVIIAQIELLQNLDVIAKGLSVRALASTTRNSSFDLNRYYNPNFYSLTYYDEEMDRYGLYHMNPEEGTEHLLYNEGEKNINTAMYMENVLNYTRTFADKHDVTGLFVFTLRESFTANAGNLQKSLAARNMGLAGRLTYGYDSRYFIEANFGYNGSERFSEKERFGFFPSGGLGWIMSNEAFWPENRVVTNLKLKGTYGLAGNDNIGGADERFFYLSDVNLDDGKKSTVGFGQNFENKPSGISVKRVANEDISWETAAKMNLGIELKLFDRIQIHADYFTERRTNILMERAYIPNTMGLQSSPKTNVGESYSSGFDASIDVDHSFNKDVWISGRFNFTYAKGHYEVYEEPEFIGLPWLSRVDRQIGQTTGYIAERLFIDEQDIANSPVQTFGPVMPGDIKYKDLNEDGMINSQDETSIGYPSLPNIIYGFGASFGYKGFDFSFFAQGAGQAAFFVDQTASAPFLDNGPNGKKGNNAMLQVWADDYWSEDNRNPYAKWPRLSDSKIDNNARKNTWFLNDGSYLRLKSVELGYTFPNSMTQKLRIRKFRVFLSGLNLFTISKFKLWDTEMGGDGLGYPIQRVFNLGVNVNF